ncbi:MAG: hypothetical protein FJY67_11195 [Calditrichaeota bacterium]|nr:hypothetical protein [Calditrichota bacterium]
MSESRATGSSGSIVLQIAIGVLAIILLTSILYPKHLWKLQAREEALCRDRMENLLYAAQFHARTLRQHSDDLAAQVSFAGQTETIVPAPHFKADRLTREDSGIDSFQIEFTDPFLQFNHYERRLAIDYPAGRKADFGPDSVVLSVQPKARFPFAPVSKCIFAADVPITAVIDDRGDQGCFALIGAQGRIRMTQILGDPISVKASDYIFFIDTKSLEKCPTTGTPYPARVNVKLATEALIEMMLEKSPPVEPVSRSRMLASNVVYRLLKEADGATKRALLEAKTMEIVEDSLLSIESHRFLDSTASNLNREGMAQLAQAINDSTLEAHPSIEGDQKVRWEKIRDAVYDRMNLLKVDSAFGALRDGIVNRMRDHIVAREFDVALKRVRKEGRFAIVEGGTVSTTSDSIAYYANPDLIRSRLIHERTDSITAAHLNRGDVQDLLEHLARREIYRTARVDSTGIDIHCPIEGEFLKADRSLFDRIFSVGGTANHGQVHNGDLSWSEKR